MASPSSSPPRAGGKQPCAPHVEDWLTSLFVTVARAGAALLLGHNQFGSSDPRIAGAIRNQPAAEVVAATIPAVTNCTTMLPVRCSTKGKQHEVDSDSNVMGTGLRFETCTKRSLQVLDHNSGRKMLAVTNSTTLTLPSTTAMVILLDGQFFGEQFGRPGFCHAFLLDGQFFGEQVGQVLAHQILFFC